MTLNRIIKDIKEFVESHPQINTFFSGPAPDFNSLTNLYPAVILIPAQSTIYDGKITYYFSLFAVDRLNSDKSNMNEVLSDTSLMIADVIAHFDDKGEIYGYFLDETDVFIEPIIEEFDDLLAGWVATNFSIQVPYARDWCAVPK
jgi:hypothetical protein